MKSAWGISDLVFVEHNELHIRLENDGFLDAKDHIVIPFHKCQQNVGLDTNIFEIFKKIKILLPKKKEIFNKDQEELFKNKNNY